MKNLNISRRLLFVAFLASFQLLHYLVQGEPTLERTTSMSSSGKVDSDTKIDEKMVSKEVTQKVSTEELEEPLFHEILDPDLDARALLRKNEKCQYAFGAWLVFKVENVGATFVKNWQMFKDLKGYETRDRVSKKIKRSKRRSLFKIRYDGFTDDTEIILENPILMTSTTFSIQQLVKDEMIRVEHLSTSDTLTKVSIRRWIRPKGDIYRFQLSHTFANSYLYYEIWDKSATPKKKLHTSEVLPGIVKRKWDNAFLDGGKTRTLEFVVYDYKNEKKLGSAETETTKNKHGARDANLLLDSNENEAIPGELTISNEARMIKPDQHLLRRLHYKFKYFVDATNEGLMYTPEIEMVLRIFGETVVEFQKSSELNLFNKEVIRSFFDDPDKALELQQLQEASTAEDLVNLYKYSVIMLPKPKDSEKSADRNFLAAAGNAYDYAEAAGKIGSERVGIPGSLRHVHYWVVFFVAGLPADKEEFQLRFNTVSFMPYVYVTTVFVLFGPEAEEYDYFHKLNDGKVKIFMMRDYFRAAQIHMDEGNIRQVGDEYDNLKYVVGRSLRQFIREITVFETEQKDHDSYPKDMARAERRIGNEREMAKAAEQLLDMSIRYNMDSEILSENIDKLKAFQDQEQAKLSSNALKFYVLGRKYDEEKREEAYIKYFDKLEPGVAQLLVPEHILAEKRKLAKAKAAKVEEETNVEAETETEVEEETNKATQAQEEEITATQTQAQEDKVTAIQTQAHEGKVTATHTQEQEERLLLNALLLKVD